MYSLSWGVIPRFWCHFGSSGQKVLKVVIGSIRDENISLYVKYFDEMVFAVIYVPAALCIYLF